MVLAHVLLRHEVQQEIDQVDSHVRVADAAVQDHGDRADELHLQVGVRSEVDFGLDLLEEFWILGEVLDQDLWEGQEVHGEGLRGRLDNLRTHGLIHEAEEILEGVSREVDSIASADEQRVREREELAIKLDRVLAENVGVHAQPSRHLLVERLPVLRIDSFIHTIVVPLIELLELLALEAD